MRILAIALSASFCLLNLACGPTTSSGTSDLEGSSRKAAALLSEAEIIKLSESQHFPIHPDETLTPGIRCQHPDSQRYPEEIDYCERKVSTSLKDRVIREYDNIGFEVESISRNKIKIDHYIPLCMGGDNDKTNLWPQHEVVYAHTDSLETQFCLALSRGLITQNEAIEDMLYAKGHLDETEAMLAKVKELLR